MILSIFLPGADKPVMNNAKFRVANLDQSFQYSFVFLPGSKECRVSQSLMQQLHIMMLTATTRKKKHTAVLDIICLEALDSVA